MEWLRFLLPGRATREGSRGGIESELHPVALPTNPRLSFSVVPVTSATVLGFVASTQDLHFLGE